MRSNLTCYSEEKKLGAKEYILHDYTYMTARKGKTVVTEIRTVVILLQGI